MQPASAEQPEEMMTDDQVDDFIAHFKVLTEWREQFGVNTERIKESSQNRLTFNRFHSASLRAISNSETFVWDPGSPRFLVATDGTISITQHIAAELFKELKDDTLKTSERAYAERKRRERAEAAFEMYNKALEGVSRPSSQQAQTNALPQYKVTDACSREPKKIVPSLAKSSIIADIMGFGSVKKPSRQSDHIHQRDSGMPGHQHTELCDNGF